MYVDGPQTPTQDIQTPPRLRYQELLVSNLALSAPLAIVLCARVSNTYQWQDQDGACQGRKSSTLQGLLLLLLRQYKTITTKNIYLLLIRDWLVISHKWMKRLREFEI